MKSFETERATAICILGMHRSGTSAITRGLNLLGAYLGEDAVLMPPLPENPEGFWERMDVYYLQEKILSVLARDWGTSVPLPEHWHKADEIRPLKNELVKLVSNNFFARQLWVWKDPRTCLLLPLWKDVLAELGIGAKFVFVVRNPLDVARSLKKRNGFPLDKGFGIWFNYTIAALVETAGLESIFLSYDQFLENWTAELKKCAIGLGIDWPEDETVLRQNMESFVRHDLRHSVSGLDELRAAEAPEPVLRLFGIVSEFLSAGRGGNTVAANKVDAIYKEFLDYARLLGFNLRG